MKNSAGALGAPNTVVIMPRAQGSGLSREQAEHLAGILRKIRDKQFDGNATTMAKAWRISQPQLSQILAASGRGAGIAVLCRIRLATGRSIDDLLGLGVSEEDRIRAAVERALDEREREIVVHPSAKARTTKLLPPKGKGTS